ncbi:hypothetical protein McanMca71_006308 [Microsporum canis]
MIFEAPTYVEVYNLREEGANDEDEKDPEKPLFELRGAHDLGNDGGSEPLGGHNAESTGETADGEVDEHALLAVPGTSPDGKKGGDDNDDAGKGEKARREAVALHVLDIGHRRLRGSVHGDDDGPDETVDAADFPHEAEALLEEDGGEDGGDDDGERAQGSDEDGIDKGVGDEVAELAQDHQGHASPPVDVLEVAISLAGLFVVLDVGFEQANLLEDEGDADEEARGDGEGDANGLERWWTGVGRPQGAARASD